MQLNKSDSDLSSSSSWTFLHGPDSPSRTNSFENVGNGKITKELLNQDIEAADAGKKSSRPESGSKGRKNKKPAKKNRTDYTNLLSIIACLFTLTGITLLTTLFPPHFTESATLDQLQHNLAQVYDHTNHPTSENASGSIQATMKAMASAKYLHFTDDDEDPTCEAPEYVNNSLKIQVIGPYAEEALPEPAALETSEEPVTNISRSLYDSAKALLENSSLQMFVATLIQDVCLIKLISEFSKRTREEEEPERSVEAKKVRKVLPKKKPIKAKKLSKAKAGPERQKVSPLAPADENGKSECERRFEELDSRWSALGQNHRQKIQQIKSKFSQEICQIKEQEAESLTRKQKIDSTRDKFLQRLKSDREIYLRRLRKLREEKQKVLNEVCQSVKTSRNLSCKDVSVGNFAVLLPSQYSFSAKLQEIKSKQLEAVRNQSISYVPANHAKTFEELRKKYEEKRARLLNKRHMKKQLEELQSSSKSWLETEQGSPETSGSKKPSKRNLNELYEAAFEQKSKKIKKHDQLKWAKKFEDFKWTTPDVPNKQMHRRKIIHKGLL